MSRNVSKLKSRFPTFPHLVSFFFSAYFIPKDWRPSLCLTLLTRNLITSHVVITPDSTAVKAPWHVPWAVLWCTRVCSTWLSLKALLTPIPRKFTDPLARGTCHSLAWSREGSGKERPSHPRGQAGEEVQALFMCSQHESPASLTAPRKRLSGRCDAPSHQGPCLWQTWEVSRMDTMYPRMRPVRQAPGRASNNFSAVCM